MGSRSIWVEGHPQPQGSMRGFVHKGRVLLTDSNKKMKPWRAKIASVAAELGLPEFKGAVKMEVVFWLPCPKYSAKAHEKSDVLPTKRPDLDKLLRAIGDALTDVWFADDSQVVEIHAVKAMNHPLREGSEAGVLITCTELTS